MSCSWLCAVSHDLWAQHGASSQGLGETPSAGLWALLWVEPGYSSQTHGKVPEGIPARR